jgi:MFS family permease
MASWTIGVPFLVLFAQSRLHFTSTGLGLFIAADCTGTVVGNFFWERLADKHSTKSCLRGAAIVSIILPLVVLLYLWFPLPRFLFASVFALAAAVDAGTSIGGMSYLLEISPSHDRATYIGLFNTLMAVPCFLTAAAGLLLDATGYGLLYVIVLLLGVASLYEIRKLDHLTK